MMPGTMSRKRRRPAGSHLCATTSAITSAMLAAAIRVKSKVASSGASSGAYLTAVENKSGQSTIRNANASQCGDQHMEDRFESQQQPVARLHDVVGAVEPDAQALDPAGGEKERERAADGEHVAARAGEHLVNLA